jgi:hypothetical protein
MDGSRLEKITIEGVYLCEMIPHHEGKWDVYGVNYQLKWILVSENRNKSLMSKMVAECFLVAEEAIVKTNHHPSKIISSSSEDFFYGRPKDAGQKPSDASAYLVYTHVPA